MLRNFGEHAANERTFLAWVRTAIAVMAFGFLIERFNLFIRAMRNAGTAPGGLGARARVGELAGLALIALGVALVAVAAVRFLRIARNIDDPTPDSLPSGKPDLALAGMLILLGCALFAYLVSSVLGTG